MTVQTIRFDVARLLADANEHVREAEQMLAHGADRERVKAAGELVALKRHKEALEARLNDIDHCPPNAVAGRGPLVHIPTPSVTRCAREAVPRAAAATAYPWLSRASAV